MGFGRRGLAAVLDGALDPDCQAAKQERGVAVEAHVAVVVARFVHLDEAVREGRLRNVLFVEELPVWLTVYVGLKNLQVSAARMPRILQPLGVHAIERTNEDNTRLAPRGLL